jgi:hypothetical protein
MWLKIEIHLVSVPNKQLSLGAHSLRWWWKKTSVVCKSKAWVNLVMELTPQIGVNDIAAEVYQSDASREPPKRLDAPDKDAERTRNHFLCRSL